MRRVMYGIAIAAGLVCVAVGAGPTFAVDLAAPIDTREAAQDQDYVAWLDETAQKLLDACKELTGKPYPLTS